MAFWGKFYNYFSGNATSDRYGEQDSSPSVSAYDETANIGIDSAMQISTVWACVTLIVENVASLPLVPYTLDNQNRRIVDRDSEIYRILHSRTNDRHTAIVFWMIMFFNYVFAAMRMQEKKLTQGAKLFHYGRCHRAKYSQSKMKTAIYCTGIKKTTPSSITNLNKSSTSGG